MNFQPVDRTLMWEFAYWAGALRRWYSEGLPRRGPGIEKLESLAEGNLGAAAEAVPAWPTSNTRDEDVHVFFDLDDPMWGVPINTYLCPRFEEEVLEDHGDWVLRRNSYGVIERNWKDRSGFPGWVRGPVESWDDWERIKAERLQPTLERRLPDDWPEILPVLRERACPLMLSGMGFYGGARYLLGDVKVLTTFYDDPELMRDIVGHLADFMVTLYSRVLDRVDVDAVEFFEDMCYKVGPLISPRMFREFILPAYKKVTACLRERGVKVLIVDTDGNCWRLLPLFVEGGVTTMSPMQSNAGMDVVEVQEAFPCLTLMGGVDKTKVAAGREAIDQELAKVSRALQHGGYIPHVDHWTPPDVSWEDFKYYRENLNAVIRGQA